MAFIREYSSVAGDPFSLRVPKRFRKMKIGRALGKVARSVLPVAAGFIPGVGGFARGALEKVLNRIPRPVIQSLEMAGYEPQEIATSFARSYGLEMGDPAPRPAQKRKRAGSGPKAKAAKKAEKRSERAGRPAKAKKSGAHGPKGAGGKEPIDWGSILGDTAGAMRGAIDKLPGRGGGALGGIIPGDLFGAGGRGRGRRTMNPANVKALRRSLRRVEGFHKLVKRVEKQYPRMRPPRIVHAGPARRRRAA